MNDIADIIYICGVDFAMSEYLKLLRGDTVDLLIISVILGNSSKAT